MMKLETLLGLSYPYKCSLLILEKKYFINFTVSQQTWGSIAVDPKDNCNWSLSLFHNFPQLLNSCLNITFSFAFLIYSLRIGVW